jgi:hypothetical protein
MSKKTDDLQWQLDRLITRVMHLEDRIYNMEKSGQNCTKEVKMSLSTTEAVISAISDLENAKLCLIDALLDTGLNIAEELEQIESITNYLQSKLEIKLEKEKNETTE